MILTYELVDNPGYEYEDEVQTQFDACVRLQSIEPLCVWWQLTDGSGELVMLHPHFTEDFFGFCYLMASCSNPKRTPFRAMRA